ncbi:hypothetical protein CDL15_Pgr013472 [Punica granatum]|uniref:MADS-box domain-containing protein n=1 Tax=Punica granatum TaxID=22663 RepID=A0A218W0H7_PUNGR|nr:hypothetical protein CDL15_Pgr013472 [Punica granatum]
MEPIKLDGRKCRGHHRMEIKRIENREYRLHMFRIHGIKYLSGDGLYKKVSELATLCGAEIGLVMFSPTGVPFSIGHPSIEAVLERILNWKNGPQQQIVNGNRGQSILEARSSNRTQELREHLNENWS